MAEADRGPKELTEIASPKRLDKGVMAGLDPAIHASKRSRGGKRAAKAESIVLGVAGDV
jgi:hypothetical protein